MVCDPSARATVAMNTPIARDVPARGPPILVQHLGQVQHLLVTLLRVLQRKCVTFFFPRRVIVQRPLPGLKEPRRVRGFQGALL